MPRGFACGVACRCGGLWLELLQLVAFCTQPAGMAAARLPSVRLLICQLAGFGQTRQKEKTLKTVLWIKAAAAGLLMPGACLLNNNGTVFF